MLPLAGSIQQQMQLSALGEEAALPSIGTLLSQIGAGQAGTLVSGEATLTLPVSDEEISEAMLTDEEAALLAAQTAAVINPLPLPLPAKGTDPAAAVREADTSAAAARTALTGLATDVPATAVTEAAEPATDTDPLNTALLNPAGTDSSQADEAFSPLLLTPQNNAAATGAPTTPASVLAAAAPAETSISTAATVAAQKNATTSLPDELNQALREERLNFGNDRSTWGGALGARVVAMVMNDIQHARIHLDPPELGSLEIRMQVQQDQATVQVQAQSAQVRDVLESSAQRLRDALASQGIQLAGFDVSERGHSQAQGDGQSQGQGAQSDAADGEWLATDESGAPAPAVSLNLLDTYA